MPTAEQRLEMRFFFRGNNRLEIFERNNQKTFYFDEEETVVDIRNKRFSLELGPVTETGKGGVGGFINYAIVDENSLVIRRREYPFEPASIHPGISPDLGTYDPLPFWDFNIWDVL